MADWSLRSALVPSALRTALAEVDFDRAGLLDGLDRRARRARVAVLEQLVTDGVDAEEIAAAVREDRVGLLLLERTLSPRGRYREADLVAAAGLEPDLLRRWFRALGRLGVPSDEPAYQEVDLAVARRLRDYRELGLPDAGLLTVARVVGRGLSTMADALGVLLGEALLGSGDAGPDEALRYAAQARALLESDSPLFTHILAAMLSDRVRSHAVAAVEHGGRRMQGAQEVSVCFADLVGFTALGEQLPADELGAVAEALPALVTDLVEPPVQLVKTIGDAVLLVSPQPRPLVHTGLALLDGAGRGARRLPPVRLGIATGTGLPYGGDWYGPAVNLASRVVQTARPDTVLTTDAVRAAVGDEGLRWRSAGTRRLRGVRDVQRLWRVQLAEP